MDEMRYYETYYGIEVKNWTVDFGGVFTDHEKILNKNYINEGTECGETSSVTTPSSFLFPHHTAKTYFIEGVIEGHFTLAASGATGEVEQYQVSLWKVHETTGDEEELFSTGWITIDDELEWNEEYSIGEEKVYPFWIDAWEKEKLTEFERFYLKIEVTANAYVVLWHSNDATWEDIKIIIPMIV